MAIILLITGLGVGFASGLLGVGGCFIIIPVMVVALSFGIHRAVGTSTALMIFTTIGGLTGYIYNGLKAGMPFAFHYLYMVEIRESGIMDSTCDNERSDGAGRCQNRS